jgi:FlaA1/EpsC-like NDP-sugar epimerase
MHKMVLTWPRLAKLWVVIALDVVLALIATWIAFSVRLDVLHVPDGVQWRVYALAPLLAVPVFIKFGLYRAIFRYTGQAALLATAQAIGVYGALLSCALLWFQWPGVPRSLGILQPLIYMLVVGTSRATARFWLARIYDSSNGESGRLLIFGAGTAGAQIAAALGVSWQFKLVGFVDDDPAKAGRSINGLPVFSAANLVGIVQEKQITDILLAMPNASRDRRNRIIKALDGLPIHVRTLPSMADLASGRVTVQDIRELDIEDLLGREPVPPCGDLLARDLAGQVVLVTGAGGSIGGELVRQIVLQGPRQLLLLDHNEFGLYSIHQELQAMCNACNSAVLLVPLLGSAVNARRMLVLCEKYRPDTVYHAAAYKHVPMVESNAGEGILNNVFGTLNMARAAQQAGARRFVLISTDKAVRPTNVMGATKRMAELVLQALAAQTGATCFSMVRFGNVLGSSGSVVPLFRKQLSMGGPLTVTHAEITRYFMTIAEAAQLVLQAGAMGQGGDVFLLDMGEPVKIVDLARHMVQLSGLSVRDQEHPQGDIEIAITGMRPGEKLYEELLIGDNPQPTEHPRIMRAQEDFMAWSELDIQLNELLRAAQENDEDSIKAVLQACVHGYSTSACQSH